MAKFLNIRFLTYISGTLIIAAQAHGAVSPQWKHLHNQFDAGANATRITPQLTVSAPIDPPKATNYEPLNLAQAQTTPAPAQPDDQTTSSTKRMSPVLGVLIILGIGAVVVGLAGALAGGILGGVLGGAIGGTWLQAWAGTKIGLLAGGLIGAIAGAALALPVFSSIVRHT